jgi:hypothetical protein
MSLTNVSFPPEKTPLLQEAVAHYRFESLAAFFRVCGHVIIEHYERGDRLSVPFQFSNGLSPEPTKALCKRSKK